MSGRLVQGVFDTEAGIMRATRSVRAEEYAIVDVYTPYAVHGLERAMGLAPTRLTWVCFLGGLFGVLSALYFQFWTSAVDWPLNIGGKPFDSLPAFVPIAFEITILFAGMGVVIALFLRCGLVPGRRTKMPKAAITDDRFVLLMRLEGAAHTVDEAREFLLELGAESVQDYVEDDA